MKKIIFGIMTILTVTALVSCGGNENTANAADKSSENTPVIEETLSTNEETGLYNAAEETQKETETEEKADEEALTETESASEENEVASSAYSILKKYIEENGEKDEDGILVKYLIDEETCIFLEIDNEGQMLWTAFFDEEEKSTVLSVYIDEIPQSECKVEMLMKYTESEEVFIWDAVLDPATLNYNDFNTVNLEITSASSDVFTNDKVLPTMTINTQITVLCTDIAMNALNLDVDVEDFGFQPTV